MAWASQFHLPLQITEPNGLVKTFTYDAHGNMLSRTERTGNQSRTWTYTYNGSGQVLTAANPAGNVTTYSYDSKGDISTTTNALGHVHTSRAMTRTGVQRTLSIQRAFNNFDL